MIEKNTHFPFKWKLFVDSLGESVNSTSGFRRGRFVLYYLPKGRALTLTNTLRRIMFDELTGVAITGLEWLPNLNELTHISGVKESTQEVLLRLKSVKLRTTRSLLKPLKIRLVFAGPGQVQAKHFLLPDFIEVVNPELPLMTVTTAGIIDFLCYVEEGVGFVNQYEDLVINRDHFLLQQNSVIPLNTNFNAVVEANYMLQDRILEDLRLREPVQIVLWDITTTGTLKPFEALTQAASVASSLFQDFCLNLNFISKNSNLSIATPIGIGLISNQAMVVETILIPFFISRKFFFLNKVHVPQFMVKSRRYLSTIDSLIISRPNQN